MSAAPKLAVESPMISRVHSSNLKGGLNAELGRHTLVLGPSASGKSALIQAIECALGLGESDYQGREVVKLPAWERMLTADGQEPDVELTVEPETTGGRLLYREALAALRKSPIFAMAALVGLAAPEALSEENEAIRGLDFARHWQGVYAGARPVDPKWLSWFADERSRASRMHEKARVQRSRELAEVYREASPIVRQMALAASQYVPIELGDLVVDLGRAKAPKCALGLRRAGRTRYGLSGSEWSICVSALAVTMADPGKLCLVIPEDRAVSPGLLSAWLERLSFAPCQVLITAVNAPERLPADWKVWSPDAAS